MMVLSTKIVGSFPKSGMGGGGGCGFPSSRHTVARQRWLMAGKRG